MLILSVILILLGELILNLTLETKIKVKLLLEKITPLIVLIFMFIRIKIKSNYIIFLKIISYEYPKKIINTIKILSNVDIIFSSNIITKIIYSQIKKVNINIYYNNKILYDKSLILSFLVILY